MWADQIRNERYSDPTHSHTENLDLYNHLNELTAELLKKGQNVVFDTGFNFYKDREYLRSIATQHGARVQLVWVQADKDLAKQRATHDNHATDNSYPQAMSFDRFDRISGDFELPRPNERCIKLDGTKITEPYVRSKLEHLL